MADVIDLEKRRNANLAQAPFVDLGELDEDEPARWLCQLFRDGVPVPDRCGIAFGLEEVPAVAVTAAQARALGEALIQVADHLESP